jgi:hypothetical protein
VLFWGLRDLKRVQWLTVDRDKRYKSFLACNLGLRCN